LLDGVFGAVLHSGKTNTKEMKLYYILLLGAVGLITGEEHNRVRRQNAVSPVQPGLLFCPPGLDACPQDCARQFYNDPQTGCRRCRCDPNDNSNPFFVRPINKLPVSLRCAPNPPCPADCATQTTINQVTGCRECTCKNNNSGPTPAFTRPINKLPVNLRCAPNPPCPADCATQTTINQATGCRECTCKNNNSGPTPGPFCNPRPPCPQDCATTFITDPQSGCQKCTCRPTIGRPTPKPTQVCNPNPPCPADCPSGTLIQKDPQTGCGICRCRPTIGRPFPGSVTVCNPNPPCPQDCATQSVTDPQTGCQKCTCKTNTGNANVDTCTPGRTWQQECNSCFCTPNGIPACTLQACNVPICAPVACPGGCSTLNDPKTGCPTCNCQQAPRPNCPPNACPADCATQFVQLGNGCVTCACRPNNNNQFFNNPFAG
ncbi:unnamed protein product, partial [Meganyctiphanes norvegica]